MAPSFVSAVAGTAFLAVSALAADAGYNVQTTAVALPTTTVSVAAYAAATTAVSSYSESSATTDEDPEYSDVATTDDDTEDTDDSADSTDDIPEYTDVTSDSADSAEEGDEDYCDEDDEEDDGEYDDSTTVTSADPVATGAYTISTIYSTNVYTVTSCADYVTDCPARLGQVTTEIISVATTVCPVEETAVPTETGYPVATETASPVEEEDDCTTTITSYTTSTQHVTKVFTVTACGGGDNDCTVGQVTTEVVPTATVVPVVLTVTTSTPKQTGVSTPKQTGESTPGYTGGDSDEKNSPAGSSSSPSYDSGNAAASPDAAVKTTETVTPLPSAHGYVSNGTHASASANAAVSGHPSASGSYYASPSSSIVAASGAQSATRVGVSLLAAAGVAAAALLL